MKSAVFATLLLAGSVLLGPSSASAVSIDFVPAGPTAVLPGDFLSVDVVVSDLGGDIVSAYDLDIVYDPVLLLPLTVTFAGSLGLPDIESITGAFDLLGILDVFEVSLLSDAELAAIQGDPVPLFTMDFVALDIGDAAFEFIWDDFNDVKGGNNRVIIPTIPEPSTWLLMGIGLAGLWGGSRRLAKRA